MLCGGEMGKKKKPQESDQEVYKNPIVHSRGRSHLFGAFLFSWEDS